MSRGPHGTFLLKNFSASSVPLVTRDERAVGPEAVCSLGPLRAEGWSLACRTRAEG